MSKNKSAGPNRFTLKSPASETAMALFLLALSAFIVVGVIHNPSVATLVGGAVVIVLFGGLGVLLLVMAVARARWVRAYKRVHGYPPY